MKNKRFFRKFLVLTAVMFSMTAFSVTAYAGGGEAVETPPAETPPPETEPRWSLSLSPRRATCPW